MAEADKVFYGGGENVGIYSPDGVSTHYVAKDLILTAEFELSTVRPGELAPNQDHAAFLLTFKGVEPDSKVMQAVTVVFESDLTLALIKALRSKLIEIPVELR